MTPKAPSALLLLLLLLISTSASAFNITTILEQYPDFSGFNTILNQTGLAEEINRRTTLTVLAVDGSGIGAISGLPVNVQKRILSIHIILDYYDTTKFQNLKRKSTSLTTLFQTTGIADQRQGFLNMTKGGSGEILFGSAMPGSPLNARYVKTVVAKPYNISVLQVSSVIVPPGITDLKITPLPPSPPPPPPPPAARVPTAAPSKSEESAPVEAPAVDGPKANAPTADAPEADAPAADAPVADAPGPAKADTADEPKPEEKSDAGQVAVGAGFGVVMMAGAALLGL